MKLHSFHVQPWDTYGHNYYKTLYTFDNVIMISYIIGGTSLLWLIAAYWTDVISPGNYIHIFIYNNASSPCCWNESYVLDILLIA